MGSFLWENLFCILSCIGNHMIFDGFSGFVFHYFASSLHPLLLIEHRCSWTGRSAVEVNVESERFTVVCSRCR